MKIKLYQLNNRDHVPVIENGRSYDFSDIDNLTKGLRFAEKKVFGDLIIDTYFPKIIWLISGKELSNEDYGRLRVLWQATSKTVVSFSDLGKESEYRAAILGFFTHFFVGFKISTSQSHSNLNDANFVDSCRRTIKRLIEAKDIKIVTTLCAQRESNIIDKDTLVEEVDHFSVQKIRNLFLGIVDNVNINRNIHVEIFQPTDSERSISSIFPTIVERYQNEDNMDELKRLLLKNERETVNILSDGNSIEFKSRDVGEIQKWAAKKRSDLFSEDIKYEDLEKMVNLEISEKSEADEVAGIALNHTMPTVSRVLSQHKNQPQDRDIALVEDVLKETLFYLCLGEYCQKSDSIFIGLERDFDIYKLKAFRLGYLGQVSSVINRDIPFVIARRNLPIQDGSKDLDSISFRQFWRKGVMTTRESTKTEKFLDKVSNLYEEKSYHNFYHAQEVVRDIKKLQKKTKAIADYKMPEKLIVFAGYYHDVLYDSYQNSHFYNPDTPYKELVASKIAATDYLDLGGSKEESRQIELLIASTIPEIETVIDFLPNRKLGMPEWIMRVSDVSVFLGNKKEFLFKQMLVLHEINFDSNEISTKEINNWLDEAPSFFSKNYIDPLKKHLDENPAHGYVFDNSLKNSLNNLEYISSERDLSLCSQILDSIRMGVYQYKDYVNTPNIT